jgi:hypothetical protein
VAAIAAAAEATPPVLTRPLLEPNLRTTSDAPTTLTWPPPEHGPSKLRRYAPFAAALGAVALAFFVGIQVGKRSPNAATAPAAAAAPPPPVARATAEIAAAPTAPPAPASEAHAPEVQPATPTTAQGSRTGLVNLKPSGRFSTKAANAALAQVAGRARACRKPGSAGGTALALVTFGPSGRVEDVTVSGARFAGTPVATCIASTLSAARVAPFNGTAQTVKRAIRVD